MVRILQAGKKLLFYFYSPACLPAVKLCSIYHVTVVYKIGLKWQSFAQ